MKNALKWIVVFVLVCGLTACNRPSEAGGKENLQQQALENNAPLETQNNGLSSADGSNILIAYFTWAKNTIVENADIIDIDATTSASVLPPGNTGQLAEWIHEEVGGDLFPIVVTEPYSSDYDETLARAADEKAEDARPQLTTQVENIEDYDVIFLGYPDWWYTSPMAVFTFLEEYDLSGKTIIPFCAHGTSGLANSIEDITDKIQDSTILRALGVYREDMENGQEMVKTWIEEIGFTK